VEKLFDAELRVMDIVWEQSPISAKRVSLIAAEKYGWNKNTTYTVIKRLIEKGALRREEPGFICAPVLDKADIQKAETKTLIERLFGGSKKAFFAAFADDNLSREEIEALRELIERKS